MSYTKPLPKITPLNKPFWEAARAGRLAVQKCSRCGHVHFPPGPACPECLGDSQEWTDVSGRGTLQSWIDFHRAYWPSFAESLPYRVCLVQLEEGPLLISNLVGDADGVKLGTPVEVVFDAVTDDVTLPKFRVS